MRAMVLIPLGAGAFLSLGRHPLAGLAAAFSGVAAVFGVNFLIVPIDGILTEITNDAIHLLNPAQSIALTANFYFAVVSSLVLIVVCSLVTERVVELRLGEYRGEVPAESSEDVSPEESEGVEVRALRAGGEHHCHCAVDVSGGGPAAGSADRCDYGQLAVYGQLDCADHAGVSGGRDRLRRRREDDHEYGRRHQRRHQNLCRAKRPNFSAVCHQSISRLFQLQQHRHNRGRRFGRCARTYESRYNSIIVGVYHDYWCCRRLDCRRYSQMGDIRADFRAAVHETGDRARSRAGSLPGGRLAAQWRFSADALFRADRRLCAALPEGCRCRHRGGDDAPLRVRDLGRLDSAVSRLGIARASFWARVTDPRHHSADAAPAPRACYPPAENLFGSAAATRPNGER